MDLVSQKYNLVVINAKMTTKLYDCFRIINSMATHPTFPNIALRTPAGCAQLLGNLMHADLAKITGQNEGNLDRIYRIRKKNSPQVSQHIVFPFGAASGGGSGISEQTAVFT